MDLKAELTDARHTNRELENDNEEIQDRLDEIAGIVVEDEDELDDEEFTLVSFRPLCRHHPGSGKA